jgi:hypothetical protein
VKLSQRNLKPVTAALCAYEAVAIFTGKVPTLSRLTARHPWLGPFLVAGFAAHIYQYRRQLLSVTVQESVCDESLDGLVIS